MLLMIANAVAFIAGVVIVVTTIVQIVKEVSKWVGGQD